MISPNPVTLIVNGFTLSLAMGFLLIILWYDARKSINQFFAVFLFLVIIWNTGFLLSQAVILIEADPVIFDLVYGITQIGFTGSTVALYVIVTILAGIHTRRFRMLAFASLLIILGYNSFLIVSTQFNTSQIQETGISFLFFMCINTITTYLTWHYRQKIQNNQLIAGIMLFIIGQGLAFLNTELGITATAYTISAIGCLILSFAIIQEQIIAPLKNQELQLRAMHEVTIAITGQIPTDTILKEITQQAKNRVDADAACIFLKRDNEIELVALYNLPEKLEGLRLNENEGIAGKVIQTKQAILIENYSRDWKGTADIPDAHNHFGGIICVPLTYKENVIGTLMTINGKNSKVPKKEDVELLELLSSQAAVAISQGVLFKEQRTLADQLRKLLISTENPVIAADRQLKLVFINPAAEKLLQLKPEDHHKTITEIIPKDSLPASYRTILQDIHRNRTYTYEIITAGETYLCHLTSLGEQKIEGWVAVLNNITQLKELDRIKSEVVRMTSHDLKNPLQAAMAHIDLLKDDLEEVVNNKDLLVSTLKIEKQLEKMNRIIGGILDLERIRTSTNLQETCNTAEILTNAVSELRDIAQDKRIELKTNIAENIAEFQGDTGLFERAIVNLIENAIKFTPGGGQVNISARSQHEKITIIISDTGIGIPKDIQEHIFERFYRGQQPGAEHISGSGLGLNLVKTVIDNHRGYIEVTSIPGAGTRFTITIPATSTRSPVL